MSYVRCVDNRAYLQFPEKPLLDEPSTLTIGRIYKTLPAAVHEREHGWLRVVDDTGEDYLFPASYFELIDLKAAEFADVSSTVTLHLSSLLKGILQAEAAASHKSVSGLLREWLDERLDLAVTA